MATIEHGSTVAVMRMNNLRRFVIMPLHRDAPSFPAGFIKSQIITN